MLPIPRILILVHTVAQLLSSSDFLSHFRICRIRESLLRVGAFSNASSLVRAGLAVWGQVKAGPAGLASHEIG